MTISKINKNLIMRKLQLFLILALIALAGCGKDNFFDKYPPEVMYYQNADVENADFNAFTLAKGVITFTVKARVSAPYKLKEIKIYKSVASNPAQVLVSTFTDFTLSPKVLKVNAALQSITENTTVNIVATDMNNKVTTKIFTLTITP
jgi:hypothetical protein